MYNEPNDYSQSENCVEMQTRSGQWNDVRCYTRRHFMCKKKLGRPNSRICWASLFLNAVSMMQLQKKSWLKVLFFNFLFLTCCIIKSNYYVASVTSGEITRLDWVSEHFCRSITRNKCKQTSWTRFVKT